MKFCITYLFSLFLIFNIQANSVSLKKIHTLYTTLDPKSISQHLAFYQLYPDTFEGKQSLKEAYQLLFGQTQFVENEMSLQTFTHLDMNGIIALVNKHDDHQTSVIGEQELLLIEKMAARLPNRQLKGYYVKSEAEVFALPPEEIDLARGLFLSQLSDEQDPINKIRSYEAMIDLMALQILTKLPLDAKPEVKIRHMNDFIFDELGFRFPPHSLYAKDIDLYTFLPSVLDSRRGVCLGVSILYICLAQRLNLVLEMITPPGHIYVRYRDGEKIINIETTARGMNLESEVYLGVNTRSLQQRNIKEVIGLAHFNQAAVYLYKEDYETALACYLSAQPYIPHDMLLMELMGYTQLLNGNKEEGIRLLKKIQGHTPDHAVYKETAADDYLKGNVDEEGIKAMFMYVDETRDSIQQKRIALENVLKRFPYFRAGLFSLAGTWLQLHRTGESLEVLEKYHQLDPNDPTTEYYLANLYLHRFDYKKAWTHLINTEQIVKKRDHSPKPLITLRRDLMTSSPE